MKRTTILMALLLALVATSVSAQSLTGTLAGKVADEQGAVLPGVTVTLVGKQGNVPTVTDERGEYRFVGINPGTYEVKAELAGFAPRSESGLVVTVGRAVAVNFTLKVGAMAETIDVVGNAATVDITSTATDNSLSQDLLSNMPINIGNFNSAVSLLNYTPGVNSGSGFGGDASYGNALMIDGVDTRDPDGGSAWVFYNFNIVEEVQVGGLGAPAEYGGFSGAVVNTITKSGGNKYAGLFEIRHTNDNFAGKNVSDENLVLNPALGNANILKKLNDFTVQLGGPFVKDKAFWWFSAQRYAIEQDPTGPRTINTEVSPRYNAKVTFNLSPTDTLIFSGQYDNYNVTGRAGFAGSTYANDAQTLHQDSPEAIWNAQYRKVIGSSTFLEAKFTGYWGYYYLDPIDMSPVHYDFGTGETTGGAGYLYYADRGRNQVNVSLSRYADWYGKHNFKFGVEIERSKSKSKQEYSGNVYYVDYYGEPYYAYSGVQYNIEGRNKRESFYAQDQWRVGRLTANLGLRLDRIRGYSPNDDKTVYTPNLAWGPRAGFAFDVTGKGNSVLKGYYGRYFEGASFTPWQRATSGYYDYVSSYWNGSAYEEYSRVPELVYGIDDDINHLGLDEVNIGFEQQVRRDMRVSVTGIYRNYRNFINSVIPNATWTPVAVTNALTSQPMTLYRWANRAATEEEYLIRNIEGFQYVSSTGGTIATLDPKRTYKGVMAVLTKSYANRWHAQLSYVWSKSEGTVGNAGLSSVYGSTYENPSLALTNTDGIMPMDRTHEIKLMGGYQIPVIEVAVNGYYRAVSGTPYEAYMNVSGSTLNWTGTSSINLEPRGSRRLDMYHQIDLRAEKTFNFDVHRFGVYVDVQNLLNADGITSVQARYPNRSIAGNTVLFGSPATIQGARQVTFGGRWSF
jgi:hypothetical protein